MARPYNLGTSPFPKIEALWPRLQFIYTKVQLGTKHMGWHKSVVLFGTPWEPAGNPLGTEKNKRNPPHPQKDPEEK